MQPTRTRSAIIVAVALAAIVAAGIALRYEIHAFQPDSLYDQARAARRAGKSPRPKTRPGSARTESPHRASSPVSAHAASQQTDASQKPEPSTEHNKQTEHNK